MYAYRKTISLKLKKFKYYDESGKEIKDKKKLEYIKSIHIPPAYRDVKIDLNPRAKIRVKGIDEAGRKQWLYNPTWNVLRSKQKYCRLIGFGKALPSLRKDIDYKLNNSKEDSKERVIALILYIIINCKFRIGNKFFRDNYNSYGITTLTKKQVKVDKNSVLFDFIGKKGVPNKCLLKDKKVSGIIANLYHNKNSKDNLFTYEGLDKTEHAISSCDINEYLKKYGKFSSKDFRTWMANVQYLSHLQEFHKDMKHITEGERKKVVSETVKKTAEELHHTPAICRKSYINQQLISDYIMKGDVVKGEKGFIAYLEKRCKK